MNSLWMERSFPANFLLFTLLRFGYHPMLGLCESPEELVSSIKHELTSDGVAEYVDAAGSLWRI